MLRKILLTLIILLIQGFQALVPRSISAECDFPFRDLNGHWAYYAVEDLYCRGVVEGRSYFYYEPDETITRAEFLKIALLNHGVDVNDYNDETEPYADVQEDDWFYPYVQAGYALGMIHYCPYYRPDDEINRAEAITMLVRLSEEVASEEYTSFIDVPLDAWFTESVRVGENWSVVEGYEDDTYRPSNSLTRAEAATMTDRAYDAWYAN